MILPDNLDNMGIGDSRGGLHIDLENPNVLAGSEITGLVHVVVKETTPAHSLELLLKGKEITRWTSGSGKNKTHHYGNRKFLRWEMPLFVFSEGCLKPGHYNFPFAIYVPGSLPGSFSFARNATAQIIYKLGARVIGEGAGIPKTTIPLIISQTTYAVDSPANLQKTARMSTWCCLGQGEANIKAETDKLTYVIGETAATVMTAVNQGSELACTGFRASLIRTIVMRDDLNRTRVDSSVVSTADLPHPIPAHHPTPVTQSLVLPITSDGYQTNTVQGQLIQCKYEIKCETLVDGCCMCCGDIPAVEKHVVICPSSIPRMAPPPLPDEWKALIRT